MSTKVQIGKYEIDRDTAEAAVCFLAGKCNFASTHDGVGFSKVDVDFGHSLAGNVEKYGRLTERQHAAIVMVKANGDKRNGLIYKYRGQLSEAGFNVEAILDGKPAQREMTFDQPKPVLQDVLIEASARRSTDLGLCVAFQGRDIWLPKSKIEVSNVGNGLVLVKIPGWLAKEKNICGEADDAYINVLGASPGERRAGA